MIFAVHNDPFTAVGVSNQPSIIARCEGASYFVLLWQKYAILMQMRSQQVKFYTDKHIPKAVAIQLRAQGQAHAGIFYCLSPVQKNNAYALPRHHHPQPR
jgi:hypothetical protein